MTSFNGSEIHKIMLASVLACIQDAKMYANGIPANPVNSRYNIIPDCE